VPEAVRFVVPGDRQRWGAALRERRLDGGDLAEHHRLQIVGVPHVQLDRLAKVEERGVGELVVGVL
jgi:hypothetical protein